MTDRRQFLGLAAAGAAIYWVPGMAANPATPAPLLAESIAPLYTLRNGGIVTRAGRGYFSNRPLYGTNNGSFVLAGDQPLLRLGQAGHVYGSLLLAFGPADALRWLHELSDVEAVYREGVAGWRVRDQRWPGVTVHIDTVPTVGVSGFALRLRVEGAREGDQLSWAYGGMYKTRSRAAGARDVLGHSELLNLGFPPEQCVGNRAGLDGEVFHVGVDQVAAAGRWSVPVTVAVSDASALSDPRGLADPSRAIPGSGLPLVVGRILHAHLDDAYLAVVALGPDGRGAPPEPKAAFEAALPHRKAVAGRLILATPDPGLNALGPLASLAIDGLWRPPVFVHGAMLWDIPLLGWRTLVGATALGWHERVAAQARHYLSTQVTSKEKTTAKTDPLRQHSEQHPDSRMYGRGRIAADQRFYDMQSQFFDQLIHNWRATGDAAFEACLRPALELHLEWLRECFDPDEDGLYESYLNCWPTDSVWYNGGGSVEATMYAWRGHTAALDMARRAVDEAAASRHRAMLERIRAGFFGKLWIARKGHPGAYIEQGGHQRRHEDPWLYSIFLPLDAESLLTPEQAVQVLYYSKSVLENQRMPLGGRTVVASNWVPAIWSVRENWPGDNYHLALAYFKAGLAEDGWDILRGTYMQAAFNGPVPGNLGGPQGGTDFGDCVNMFCRAVVEGLFGYRPDYPNGRVLVTPQFPADWATASIRTPDFALTFDRAATHITLVVELTRPAPLTLRLPVRGKPKAVHAAGQAVPYRVVAGFGQSIVEVELPAGATTSLLVKLAVPAVPAEAEFLTGKVGETVTLKVKRARIVSVSDPEGALVGVRKDSASVSAALAANPGHHTVFIQVEELGAMAWRVFHLRIDDPAAERIRRDAIVQRIPARARWSTVALDGVLNGDIRTIFKQSYMSPRPDTVSLRIGSDGYSPWTFTHWKIGPPKIGLDRVASLRSGERQIRTPQGVPFAWSDERNVAFVSLWDNWPDQLGVPVGRAADAIFLLIAGSTNVMQCHIANAVVRLHYADGQDDKIELIPPLNYWNLCPIAGSGNGVEQNGRGDYTDPIDAFAVPKPYPETVQLGENCRAMLLNRKLRPGVTLARVTIEALSQEVVVGLMGVTLLNPRAERA